MLSILRITGVKQREESVASLATLFSMCLDDNNLERTKRADLAVRGFGWLLHFRIGDARMKASFQISCLSVRSDYCRAIPRMAPFALSAFHLGRRLGKRTAKRSFALVADSFRHRVLARCFAASFNQWLLH